MERQPKPGRARVAVLGALCLLLAASAAVPAASAVPPEGEPEVPQRVCVTVDDDEDDTNEDFIWMCAWPWIPWD